MTENYTPPCPHYRKCGGCQLQNLPYQEQLLFKQRMAVSLLGEFAHVNDIIGISTSGVKNAQKGLRGERKRSIMI